MNGYSALHLVNQAFRNLGEQLITSFDEANNPRVALATTLFGQVLETLFTEHFWNFATTRVTLLPYTTPTATLTPAAATGTGVLFTASASGVFGLEAVGQGLEGVDDVPGRATITALVESRPASSLTPGTFAGLPGATSVPFTAASPVFAAGDLGALLERHDPDALAEGIQGTQRPGLMRITAVGGPTQVFGTILNGFVHPGPIPSGAWRLVATNRLTADITTDFSGAAIPAGSWRLTEAPPAWGFRYRFRIPADYMQMQRTKDATEYQREGAFFLADEPTLSLTYTAYHNDITRWPPYFVHAFVALLTAAFAEQVSGQQAKHQLWLQLADGRVKRAKLHDGQEGSAPQVMSPVLIRARYGGWRGGMGWR